jgi:hypothetical protein
MGGLLHGPGGPGGPSGPAGEIIFSAPKAQRSGETSVEMWTNITEKNLTFGPQWAQATGLPSWFFVLTKSKGPHSPHLVLGKFCERMYDYTNVRITCTYHSIFSELQASPCWRIELNWMKPVDALYSKFSLITWCWVQYWTKTRCSPNFGFIYPIRMLLIGSRRLHSFFGMEINENVVMSVSSVLSALLF